MMALGVGIGRDRSISSSLRPMPVARRDGRDIADWADEGERHLA